MRKPSSPTATVWALVPTERTTGFAKVGGAPDVVGRMRWPSCARCQKPMRFLFQLPHRVGALDLRPFTALYVFQCENTQTRCPSFQAQAGANAVLALRGGPPSLEGKPPAAGPYLEYHLHWEPAPEDAQALLVDVQHASAQALAALEQAREDAPSTKVGGVPVWLQDPAPPSCCGHPMRFVGQVNAEPFSLSFGDDGRGFLFRCSQVCAAPAPFCFLVQST